MLDFKYFLLFFIWFPTFVLSSPIDSCSVVISDQKHNFRIPSVRGERYDGVVCHIDISGEIMTKIYDNYDGEIKFDQVSLIDEKEYSLDINNSVSDENWFDYICNPNNDIASYEAPVEKEQISRWGRDPGPNLLWIINNKFVFEREPFVGSLNANNLKKKNDHEYIGFSDYTTLWGSTLKVPSNKHGNFLYRFNDDEIQMIFLNSSGKSGDMHYLAYHRVNSFPYSCTVIDGSEIENIDSLSKKIINSLRLFNGKKSGYPAKWIKETSVINGNKISNQDRFKKWLGNYLNFYNPPKGKKKYAFPRDFAFYLMMNEYHVEHD